MATFNSPQSYLRTLGGGGATLYQLEFDGVDDELVAYTAGNTPAALQFDFPTESFSAAFLIRADTTTSYRQGALHCNAGGFVAGEGWAIESESNGRAKATINWGTGNGTQTLVTGWDTFSVGLYNLIMMSWNHATGILTIAAGTGQTRTVAVSPSSPSYATAITKFGPRSPTVAANYFEGALVQLAVWSSDQVANIADYWNGGQYTDWSTAANPPDVLHYLIKSDDDPTASGGIIDRTGNGHDATLVNGSAASLAVLPQPRV
jgi:hypothetical protein